MKIGEDYVIRDGKLVWLARYARWNGSRWISAEEQNAHILSSGVVITSWGEPEPDESIIITLVAPRGAETVVVSNNSQTHRDLAAAGWTQTVRSIDEEAGWTGADQITEGQGVQS